MDKFTSLREALDRLKDADRVTKLLTAEVLVENVMHDMDEDDLAVDMLEQVLEILAVIIERS